MKENSEPKLSDDPRKALKELSEYLWKLSRLRPERAIPPGCDKRACDKYWLDITEIYTMQGFAHEANRVATDHLEG